jgi:F-type H+-transporting ATPase subunit alpha
MTDLSARLGSWLDAAPGRIATTPLGAETESIGRVETVGDGVAMVSGLPDLRAGELIRFADGSTGLARTLDADRIGCVLLDAEARIEAGQPVRGTGEVLRVPVGEGLLGRVVDPLGRPIDEGGPLSVAEELPAERPAPRIGERDLVTEPLQTGVTLIDALLALGRGQRELILGDRQTGKTAIAVDAIINQRDSDVVCVYAAIGQKSSSIRQVIDAVRRHGDPGRCIFVVGGASSAPGLQWLAPFAAMTMAEWFRDRGGHALVVLDDLTRHAATHREIALLLRQPPGREAYPGDVFYLHSRLLERAAKLSARRGGGSLTALPIAETEGGNLSAYIPTNLISITDGQIVLDSRLFHEGRRPAIDVGRSVSRVGGKTQAPALREVAEQMRLDYAQFEELELFSRFSATLDPRARARLDHGRRIRAVLQQGRFVPRDLALEVAELLAVGEGLLDSLPLDRVPAFQAALGPWLEERLSGLPARIRQSGRLSAEDRQALLDALRERVRGLAPPPPPAAAAASR